MAALCLLIIQKDKVRKAAVYIAAIIILAASVFLLYENFSKPAGFYYISSGLVNEVMLVAEALIAVYIIYISIKFRKY